MLIVDPQSFKNSFSVLSNGRPFSLLHWKSIWGVVYILEELYVCIQQGIINHSKLSQTIQQSILNSNFYLTTDNNSFKTKSKHITVSLEEYYI